MKWPIKSAIVFLFLQGMQFGNPIGASPELIDSLRNQLPYMASDTHKVWMLRDIAYYYLSEKPDSAIIFARRGYNLARNLNFTQGQIWNLYQEGLAYELLSSLDTALKIYHRAIDLSVESGDDLSRAKLYNILGVAHYYDGNYTDAIHYYSLGFVLSDSISYTEGKGHSLNNMGVIYRKQRRFDKALEIYQRSLDLKQNERDTQGMIISFYNIGLSHSYLGDHNKSLDYFLLAEEMAESVSQLGWDKSHIEIGLGVAHFNLENFEDAKIHLENGIAKSSNPGSPEYISAKAYLGAILIREGEREKGIEQLENSWEMAAKSGHRVLQRDVLKQRALAAEIVGMPQIVTESWKKFADLNEEINSEAQSWAIEEMKARFELQDKEITIALQNLELEREKARKNLYMISGFSLLFLFAISVAFIYSFWRKREQLKLAVAQREDALSKNEILFREMHHRTKNNLQLLNSLLSLQERKSSDQKVREALQSSKDSVGAISLLHRRLYQNENFRAVAMKPYLHDLAEYFRGAFGLEDREIHLYCECDDIQIDTDHAIPLGLIINELVTNSIKHAFGSTGKGAINISLKRASEDKLLLCVCDNGSAQEAKKNGSGGTGTELLKIFSQRYNARLEESDNRPGKRTEFEMSIKEI